jgi:hypothetical protein
MNGVRVDRVDYEHLGRVLAAKERLKRDSSQDEFHIVKDIKHDKNHD